MRTGSAETARQRWRTGASSTQDPKDKALICTPMSSSPSLQSADSAGSQTSFDLAIIPAEPEPPTSDLVCESRVAALGAGALSDAELVALSLGGSGRGESALALARRLLAEAGSLHRLLAWNEADFRQRTGIGRARAWRIIAAFEAARRVFTRPVEELPILKQAEQVAQYLTPFTAGLEVEVFWTLCLNRKSRLLRKVDVTIGTATAALAHPREVFRAAIREGACSVVAAHFHPSGDPAPSGQDVALTRLLRDAAKTIEIGFQDHVIVGRASADPQGKGFFSFWQAGLL
jgi:DNA repair protein RadC